MPARGFSRGGQHEPGAGAIESPGRPEDGPSRRLYVLGVPWAFSSNFMAGVLLSLETPRVMRAVELMTTASVEQRKFSPDGLTIQFSCHRASRAEPDREVKPLAAVQRGFLVDKSGSVGHRERLPHRCGQQAKILPALL